MTLVWDPEKQLSMELTALAWMEPVAKAFLRSGNVSIASVKAEQ